MKYLINLLSLIIIFQPIWTFKINLNDPNSNVEIYDANSLIINLKKDGLNDENSFYLNGEVPPGALKITFNFIGLIFIRNKLKFSWQESSDFNLKFDFPLQPEYTGRYDFTVHYENNRNETKSLYLYFYPDDGRLFVNCQLIGTKTNCQSFYRLKVPFTIPCRALHPQVIVTSKDLSNPPYNPQLGFDLKLIKDSKEFECKANFGDYEDTQKFSLNGISSIIQIKISPELENELIQDHLNRNLLQISRGHRLELTCDAKIGCNDIYYDLDVVTNSIDRYSVEEIRDRSKCSQNPYALFDYKKIIKFDRISKNETDVTCEVNFEKSELKYKSNKLTLVFAERPFLRNTKPPIIDYSTIGSIEYFFESSSKVNFQWFKDQEEFDPTNFHNFCIQERLFEFKCQLDFISQFESGKYEVVLTSLEDPQLSINQTFYLTNPRKPDLTIYRPLRLCSANWTCELNKSVMIQCDAQAHHVDVMKIEIINCSNLDECYNLLNNIILERELISNLTLKQKLKVKRNILVPDIQKVQFTPSKFNEMQKSDDGYAWSFKKRLLIEQFHLVFCLARNEKGSSVSKKLIIPSDLKDGSPFALNILYERENDVEIVQGDEFKIQFLYNNILYSSKDFDLNELKESVNLIESSTVYSKKIELNFKNVSKDLNSNYSLLIKVNNHPYLNTGPDRVPVRPVNPVMFYELNVLEPEGIKWINKAFVSNDTNDIVVSGDVLVKPDKNLILLCEFQGRPKPSIKWFKDDALVNLNDEKFELSEGKLGVKRTHPIDSGRYECQVSNRFETIKRQFLVQVEKPPKEISKRTIAIIVIVSFLAFILSILLLIAVVNVIKQKRENKKLREKHERLFNFLSNGELMTVDDILDKKALGQIKFDDKKYEIEREKFIILDKVLGEGNFGKVCLAYVADEPISSEINQIDDDLNDSATNRIKKRFSIKRSNNSDYSISNNDPESSKPLIDQTKLPKNSRQVAVKICKDSKLSSPNLDSLLQELKILGYLGFHLNVIQLIGCYTKELKSHGSVYVFVEYCSEGDLRNWLRNNSTKYLSHSNELKNSLFHEKLRKSSRPTNDNTVEKFNDCDLVFFAYQIARGMKYLSDKKFLHRDLAARNVLIDSNFVCKISDFGLADESKLESVTFYGKAKGQVPAKWAPPEAFGGAYEATSDVWSFGVVLWEIFSLCKTDPYPDIPIREFMAYMDRIKSGEVEPDLPENGSNELHQIIRSCWTVDSNERPNFDAIVPRLEKLLTDFHRQRYLALSENFRNALSTLMEDRILKQDSNNRESKPGGNVRETIQKKPSLPPINTTNNNSGYLQPNVNNNNNNNNLNNGYLQPGSVNNIKPPSGGYLLPTLNKNNQDLNSGYLQPDKKPVQDTYTGSTKNYAPKHYPDTYIGPTPQPSYINSQQSNFPRYLNEDVINEMKTTKNFVQSDDLEDDSYVMPRHASNMSQSSTAPLYLKKLESPNSRPQKTSKQNNFHYIPPKTLNTSKLSTPNLTNETDV